MTYFAYSDPDPKRPIEQKVGDAVDAYRRKHRRPPSVALMHPTDADALIAARDPGPCAGLLVYAAGYVPRHTYYLGQTTPEGTTPMTRDDDTPRVILGTVADPNPEPPYWQVVSAVREMVDRSPEEDVPAYYLVIDAGCGDDVTDSIRIDLDLAGWTALKGICETAIARLTGERGGADGR